MDANSHRPRGRAGALSSLNMAIDALNLAKDIVDIAPAKAAFGSVSALLTMIRDSAVNEQDYVELGLNCADICRALERGMNGNKLDDLSQSVCDAINQLTATVGEIQRKVIKQSRRNLVSRLIHAKNDKEMIASWKSELNRILYVFNTELAVNTHTMVSDIHRNILISQGTDGRRQSAQTSILGESPPPPPRAIFGRDELIEKIVGLAETLTPVALIGAGGIGKTSIALTILHDDRVKQRFGQSRRFIRCDQFPPSSAHFLNRLSKVIGAGVENPEDLAPLRPTLSSKEMLIVLSNAESVLDPQGTDAREIYNVVEELSRFETICLCITSRITIVPQHYKRLVIPTLSIESARDAFYRIYKNGERSDLVSNILVQLDSHPLSITLLATTAHHNKWSTDRLTREWERRRTGLLHTHHVKSLAVTIELSLASPMFQGLGPNARDLLGIVAFFPQGVDENSIDWLFPTISNKTNIFDTFCVFALTYRSYGFVTMLAPLRDYLRPEDPKSSPLLCTTKDRYLSRLSVGLDPNGPGFEEARWIVSEDVNIEYLLDVFTSVDANSDNIWDACADFMRHLSWHNKRLVVLRPKIEGLPDDHRSKPECLFELSQLFHSIGNYVESKRLLIHALMLWRAQGNDLRVAETMMSLADANRQLSLHEEATRQAQEALEIYKSLNHVSGQAFSLARLAWLLFEDTQLDAAEAAAFQAIDLLLAEGKQYEACRCYRLFGAICRSKGEIEKAFDHFETALKISSSSNQHDEQFWSLYSLAELFYDQRRFDDAQAHVERAKLHTANDAYNLGRVMGLQAHIWYTQGRLDEAKSEALRAVDVYQKLEAVKGVEDCRMLLRDIEEKTGVPVTW